MTSKEIRQQFLDFFESKQHTIVDSSPVVPYDDPTLMFTNAGMNQFKDVFLGTGSRPYKRAADTQKCIRAGGKHNDLDDVGQDTYHHTFFEMLGNWSFGDYFKKEAIEWAWELLTEVWGIPKDRLHATYFEGDEAEGLEPDTEAAELWKSATDIDPKNIHPGNKKDNFWEMGDVGPCGPCSEIHVDLTPDKSGRSLVNAGDARVIELWNLVFIQFNATWIPGGQEALSQFEKARAPKDSDLDANEARLRLRVEKFGTGDRGVFLAKNRQLTPLPAKHVDTGMGFERLCAVLQGIEIGAIGAAGASPRTKKVTGLAPGALTMPTNYDTDVFGPIFDAIRERTGAPAYARSLPGKETEPQASGCADSPAARKSASSETPRGLKPAARVVSHDQVMVDVSYRVIADHVRCLTFALTDGAIPSNEGRGYVLRRILRRAVRYGRQYMNMHEPFLCDLIEPLVQHMDEAFLELRTAHAGRNVEHVTELIRDEEASFLKTLDRGIRHFAKARSEAIGRAYESYKKDLIFAGIGSYGAWEAEDDERAFRERALPRLRFVREATNEILEIKTEAAFAELCAIGIQVTISGADAFRLYDTNGFPIDLTELMAAESGLTIDIGEYERLMDVHKEKARAAQSYQYQSALNHRVIDVSTDDTPKYEQTEIRAELVDFWSAGAQTDDFRRRMVLMVVGDLILNRTCYYHEQGGQVGDRGIIEGPDWEFTVSNVTQVGSAIYHHGQVTKGEICLPVDDTIPVTARIEYQYRFPITQNHTSTHLLNWALREVLGDHVQQKGSLVDPEKTRFDFSHNKPVTDEQLSRIESLVTERIKAKLKVYAPSREENFVDKAEADKINTLRAVFGENYPGRVRVVSIGVPITDADAREDDLSDWLRKTPKNPDWMKYSVEFCGGTHVENTLKIGAFTLTHEEGVAKGIRRVVGISGEAAQDAVALGEQLLTEAEALRTNQSPTEKGSGEATKRRSDETEPQALACADSPTAGESTSPDAPRGLKPAAQQDLAAEVSAFQQRVNEAVIPIRVRHELRDLIAQVQERVKKEQKQSASASGEAVRDRVAELLQSAETIGGVKVVVGEVPSAPTDKLRGAIDWVRNKTDASAVMLASVTGDRITLIAGMSKSVVGKGIKAGDLIKEIAPLVGGKGGGRPDMAQGGGNETNNLPGAIDAARSWIETALS